MDLQPATWVSIDEIFCHASKLEKNKGRENLKN